MRKTKISLFDLFKHTVILLIVLLFFSTNAHAESGTLYKYEWTPNHTIPDNGGWDGRVSWSTSLSGAPSNAQITSVDVEYWINHTWISDLNVWLTTERSGTWYDKQLWNREGGSADDIHEIETGLSNWNGLLPNGTWYLMAADYAAGDEGEIDAWKIWVHWSTPASPPDLAVQSVDATNGTYQPGDQIVVYNLVRNIGEQSSNNYTVDFYASTNTNITTSDYKIGHVSRSGLAPGAQHSYNTTCQFPPNGYDGSPIPADNYYIGIIVTCSNDNNSSNNKGYDSTTVSVVEPPSPDLAVQDVDATNGTYQAGDQIDVYNLIKNIGGQTSNSYTVDFYASTNTTITASDYKIGHVSRSGLAPGAQHSYNSHCYFPPNSYDGNPIPEGDYYIGIIVTCSNDDNPSNDKGYDSSPVTVKWPEYYLKVTNLDDDTFSYVWFDIDDNHGWNPNQFNKYISVGGNSTAYSTDQDTTRGWHTVHIMWYDEDHGSWQHKSREEYIDTDETQEYAFTIHAETRIGGVPGYNQTSSDCGPVAAAKVLAYWEGHPYGGIYYWNIVDHGDALSGDVTPIEGQPGNTGLVADLRTASNWPGYPGGVTGGQLRDGIESFCNDAAYENNLNFDGNWDVIPPLPFYSTLKSQIDAGRPLVYFVVGHSIYGDHFVSAMGYIDDGVDDIVLVKDNWNGDTIQQIDWAEATHSIIKVTPGGTPADHYEPDDNAGAANLIDVDHIYNFRQTHNFYQDGDNDWVKFNAVADKEYTIETTNLGSGSDTYIYLYDTDGTTEITHDDDGGQGVASKIVWKCFQTGTYFVRIRHYDSLVSGHHTNFDIEISYEDFFTILALADPHGTIDPSGTIYKYSGEDQQFTAIPNTNYTVDKWYLDGSPVQTGGSIYTLENIQSDHTVYVIFEYVPPEYVITASADPNGSISPSGNIVVTEGQDLQFTATPDTGYIVDEWYLDGSEVQVGGTTYTLYNIESYHEIYVTFKTIIGDITGDGKVNYEDLKIMTDQWLQPPGTPSADIAPSPIDGIVNFLDFAVLAGNWLAGVE